MQRDTRAIIFDLDDTLYPIERFIWSGFDAVAVHLHRLFAVDQQTAVTVLRQAFTTTSGRGRELQICLRHFGLPEALAPSLVNVMRSHRPVLDLPASAATMLAALTNGWRIGIVTNGPVEIQQRKVEALGLAQRVDAIVFADEHAAKPAAAPFLEAASRLGVGPRRSIFVGNDPVCDVYGAWRLGMKTIHVAERSAAYPAALMADASVRSLVEVPEIAERLVA